MPTDVPMLEVKRNLDGKIVEYPAEPLLIEPGVRAVLLCRLDEPEVVAGGRLTLAPGTLSVVYFWFDRPYNVYHWLNGGETLVHYVNIGRFRSLNERALVWDDYAVDVLAFPDGAVEVVDEDEIPDTTDSATRTYTPTRPPSSSPTSTRSSPPSSARRPSSFARKQSRARLNPPEAMLREARSCPL